MSARQIVDNWESRGAPLEVPGANTWVWREGNGQTVVCLHGVPASGFLYRKVLPELAVRGVEGITFDFPGLGLADRPANFDYSWSGLATWTVGALDAANIEDFHLVVHDIGGPIGFDVIRRIPKRIRSLTVLNSILHVASFQRPWVMEPFAYPGIGWLWLQGMRTAIIIALMRTVGMHDGPTNDELRAYGELLFRKDGGKAFLKTMRSFERSPKFEDGVVTALKNKAFPAQVIWGAEDPALKMKTYALPFCQVLGLSDWHRVRGKHFLQEDSPKEIAQHVADLVASSA